MEQNLYNITGMTLTDSEVREVYGIPDEENINIAILNQHMEEAIKQDPEDEDEIRKEYHHMYRVLLQKLANKGRLVVGQKKG